MVCSRANFKSKSHLLCNWQPAHPSVKPPSGFRSDLIKKWVWLFQPQSPLRRPAWGEDGYISLLNLKSNVPRLHYENKHLMLYREIIVCYDNNTKQNSMALVRERTIPTERPPPVGEVSANFCG
jgi:hypothetical protein